MVTEVIAKCTDKFTVKHKTTKIVKTCLNIGSALSRRLNARDLQALYHCGSMSPLGPWSCLLLLLLLFCFVVYVDFLIIHFEEWGELEN